MKKEKLKAKRKHLILLPPTYSEKQFEIWNTARELSWLVGIIMCSFVFALIFLAEGNWTALVIAVALVVGCWKPYLNQLYTLDALTRDRINAVERKNNEAK